MESLMAVHLQKVRFHALHGLDAGEEITGGLFEVNLSASFVSPELPVTTIAKTLDYTILLTLIKERMEKPALLLETLATEIASEIFAKFPIVIEVAISIFKLHPPIKNFEGSVGVSFTLKRK
jgi:dihydroneopterin aldolase